MATLLPPLRLTGAHVLRDGALQARSLAFADGEITKGPLPEVDLSGYLVLPGIVDLHGDAFERHLAPRKTARFETTAAIRAADAEAAANGITTSWMAQSWSWEGGLRGPDFAESFLAAHSAYRPQALTDLRVQIRCETHLLETGPRLLETVERHGVDYVIFNNHLPEAVELAKTSPERLAEWAAQAGRTPEAHMEFLEAMLERAREVPRHLCRLAEGFDRMRVRYGSHDDADGETREFYSMIGARIAEFPTSRRAAAAASAINDPVLMGAPNVVQGGSRAGNVSAERLIREGLCDALVSDYYYPALPAAAFALADREVIPLAEAWSMISTRPAAILGLVDRGHLSAGRRADFVVIHAESRRIEATVSGGRLAYMAGEAGARFLSTLSSLRLAAE